MRVEGTYTFPGATQRVFATLTNPDALARALPGCERFIQLGPATKQGLTIYEARLRLGQQRQPYTIRAHVTVSRQPDYLRVELHGAGPSGPIDGEGSLDLVEQNAHTVAAYRLMLSGPDLVTPTDSASRVGDLIAQTTCERLADAIYDSAQGESLWLPGSALAHNQATADAMATVESARRTRSMQRKASQVGAPGWGERAIWLGAGLALGLSAIALTLAFVRRISDHETADE
jgi:carbon monoxide dehydrogenase subunit G